MRLSLSHVSPLDNLIKINKPLQPYVKSNSVYTIPTTGNVYPPNTSLSRLKLEQDKNSAETLIVYKESNAVDDPREAYS